MTRRRACLVIAVLCVLSTTALRAGEEPDWAANPPGQTEGLLKEMLDGPLGDVDEVVFATRGGSGWHWYENFGRRCTRTDDRWKNSKGPGRLCRYNLRTGELTTIFEAPNGRVRDPQVHYDGQRILFSYRSGQHPYYNLYEINIDGTGLTRLTEGPFDDYEPTYTPKGAIIFCSSRCMRYVPCWYSQVGIMYRCEADGSNIRQISAGVEHENTPWMLPDGRVLYTRWEYVNRNEQAYHHLWTINSDGTGQMVFYGNGRIRGDVMIDAKPIPGGNKVVSVFSMGHGASEHRGKLMIIDPDAGPDSKGASYRLDSQFPGPDQKKNHPYTWRDPYGISEDCFLVASYDGLYVMDGEGRYERIFRLPPEMREVTQRGNAYLHEPRPLRPRGCELTQPARPNWSREQGTFILSNANMGRSMDGVEPGTVKKLLILEELPKPISVCWDKDAISMGTTYMLHRILGTVPVEADGSAHFRAPAVRPLFFVALDEREMPVQRMQSFVSVMPGETVSCVGCHEARTRATSNSLPQPAPVAAQRGPDAVKPIRHVPDIFDYRRDIQPIWDQNCISCHNYENYAGKLILTGDLGPWYTHSYEFLHKRGHMWGSRDYGNRPYSTGSADADLYETLKQGHKDVKLSSREMDTIRLWLDSSSIYAGTYAALGSAKRERDLIDIDRTVLEKRCYECHLEARAKEKWKEGQEVSWVGPKYQGHMVNVTRPEKSLLLLAPLSKEAGGLELCQQKSATDRKMRRVDKPPKIIFENKEDPDYQALKATLVEFGNKMMSTHRYGRPGFQPTDIYMREMSTYGVIPPDAVPSEIDPYEVDRRYFRQFWHRPTTDPQ